MLKTLSLLAGFILFLVLNGCSVTPWVQSHERAILADPIMAFDRNPASARYMHHVFESREAARGAEGSGGGGCGCN